MAKTAKERVQDKFDLAKDVKGTKIKRNIRNIEMVDGKFRADFSISGLPKDDSKKDSKPDSGYDPSFPNSNKDIPKGFDNFDDLSAYAKKFFDMSDDEVIKMCKAN